MNETKEMNYGIDWSVIACRSLMIKLLTEAQLKELHELENTRCKRTYNYNGPNWLIKPFNIRTLFYPELKDLEISEKDISVVITLIKNKIPKNIDGSEPDFSSLEWQHIFDWNIFHGVTAFDKKEKKTKNYEDKN